MNKETLKTINGPGTPRALWRQRGYLMEIPLILAVVVMGVFILLPMLPPLGRKVLMVVAAFPVLFCLYYMIVIPGWRPNPSRLGPKVRIVIFAGVVVGVVAGVLMFVLA